MEQWRMEGYGEIFLKLSMEILIYIQRPSLAKHTKQIK